LDNKVSFREIRTSLRNEYLTIDTLFIDQIKKNRIILLGP